MRIRECRGRLAHIEFRSSKVLSTVVVVEYQAALTPSTSRSGLLRLSPIGPAGRVSKALPRHDNFCISPSLSDHIPAFTDTS